NVARSEPELVVVGNALSRGNPEVEAVLDDAIPYVSGPQWLAENVLASRWTLAVAGTHGKTSSASMLAWILEMNGLNPGFLIGGVPNNFAMSARLGTGDYFVVEADEYDTAFFDKRSKFVHYRPKTVILNNLEYDHADIFDSLADIKRQFHHLVRTVPGNGQIVIHTDDEDLRDVIDMGCWTPVVEFGSARDGRELEWSERSDPGHGFEVMHNGLAVERVEWSLLGRHNRLNALGAIAAAHQVGVETRDACAALASFKSVKRRLEHIGTVSSIRVYDDFAHHPTAVAETLRALREAAPADRVVAVLEPRSNTMRMGVHREYLMAALADADRAIIYKPRDLAWDLTVPPEGPVTTAETIAEIIATLSVELKPNDHVVIMSNGAFEGLHERLLKHLRSMKSAATHQRR
ncbi:MAG: UDP-N-acetylmuramate:L-alanyl-gamma-D-glutamyl-meso-diaminopimelate ligase, partial [Gammaproteobacteria bacterium]|nr:UDP-N-acetylmuramate:L-alanyl-gamma-D-glutamyl-meso-diaminopimelate ligase [Gammaproteobacteria bacterium]